MKYIKQTITLAGILWIMSCNDDLTTIGSTIQPPEDLITVYTDTFQMTASTVKLDSIFAKTADCMLGEMYDPLYGYIKADFVCQFYCETGMKFKQEPYNGLIDSVDLYMFYAPHAWYGDSLTPMQATIYPVDKPLPRNFYSNDNPETYCDMQRPLGAVSYTAYDLSVSDSIHNLASSDYNYYTPRIRIRLPRDLGQQFYDQSATGTAFSSQTAFNEFFPGIYITTTYGSGNLIATSTGNIVMSIYYNYAIESSEGQDSLVQTTQQFVVTKEVNQINRFRNSSIDRLLTPNPDYTYIKSPAGVCTKLVIPTSEISKALDVNDRYINDFTLNLRYLPADEWDFACTPPQHLLLLPEDSVKTFFEDSRIEDNTTSFISYDPTLVNGYASSSRLTKFGYLSTTRTYAFGNVSALLKTHITNDPDKDLNLLVIPVNRSAGSYAASSSLTYYYSLSVYNGTLPAGVKIRTEEEYMKVVVLSSKFENK